MVPEAELEGFRRDRYFARSWALLTRDKGWIKPVLVMAVALLVPVVGWMGVLGYIYEWARLTAWGVNAAPKQKDVRVGECIKSGARVFVVMLVWAIVMALVGSLLMLFPLFGGLLVFAWSIFSIFLGVLVGVAALRATIYQKLGAGFRVGTIWQMGTHDVSGTVRIAAISIVAGIVSGFITFFATLLLLASALPHLIAMYDMVTSYGGVLSDSVMASYVMQMVFSTIGSLAPAIIVISFVGSILSVLVSMVWVTAIGLWMRQFNVPAWGRDEDPLPPFVGDPRDTVPPNGPDYSAPANPAYPTAGYGVAADPVSPSAQPASTAQPVTQPQPVAQPAPVSQPAAPAPQPMAPVAQPVEEVIEATTIAEAPAPEPPASEGEAGTDEPSQLQ